MRISILDKGAYLVILKLNKDKNINFGIHRGILFKKGYYVYVGSGMRGLNKRMSRHTKISKNKQWHIDYLVPESEFIDSIPIRSKKRMECKISESLNSIKDWKINNFGNSDCKRCESHLYGFAKNPLFSDKFRNFVDSIKKLS